MTEHAPMDDPQLVRLTKEDVVQLELRIQKSGEKARKYGRLIASLLSALPWVGSALGAGAALHGEREQGKTNELHELWLQEHRRRLMELAEDLDNIVDRIDVIHGEVQERIESEDYLRLVRQSFKTWDNAETREKRQYIRNLIVNSATTRLSSDDVVRLFNDWIKLYHEAHFRVIRAIYQSPGSTRGEIWDSIGTSRPREDSAEADLYRMLIRDLSTGGVLRQSRDTDMNGQFLRKRPARASSPSRTMESSFDDEKPYVLTALGQQFVHYTMNEATTKIE